MPDSLDGAPAVSWLEAYRPIWEREVKGLAMALVGLGLTWVSFVADETVERLAEALSPSILAVAILPVLAIVGVGAWWMVDARRWLRAHPPPRNFPRERRAMRWVLQAGEVGLRVSLGYFILLVVLLPVIWLPLSRVALFALLILLEPMIYLVLVTAILSVLGRGWLLRGLPG